MSLADLAQRIGAMFGTGAGQPQAFGTMTPVEESAQANPLANAIMGVAGHMATLPQRAIQASQADMGNFGDHSVPLQSVAPASELALNLMGTGMPFAQKGAAGIFGGRLAKTADHEALAKAEQLQAAGAPREQIWNETGWFKGADNKWKFEIDDSKSAIAPHVEKELKERIIGDQVPVQNADRFLQHPELFEAYPDLWRVNTRVTKGGGFPYTPSAHYSTRESGAEHIGINANNAAQAKSLQMHELQHAIQQREGFAPGADANAVGMAAYHAAPGEIEAYNVQRRLFMTPEERAALPPWLTE